MLKRTKAAVAGAVMVAGLVLAGCSSSVSGSTGGHGPGSSAAAQPVDLVGAKRGATAVIAQVAQMSDTGSGYRCPIPGFLPTVKAGFAAIGKDGSKLTAVPASSGGGQVTDVECDAKANGSGKPDFVVRVQVPSGSDDPASNYPPSQALSAPVAGGRVYADKGLTEGCLGAWVSPDGTLVLHIQAREAGTKAYTEFSTVEECRALLTAVTPPLLRALATQG